MRDTKMRRRLTAIGLAVLCAALAGTALAAAWVSFRLPAIPNARIYAVVLVVAVYIILRRIATRVAMEFLPR